MKGKQGKDSHPPTCFDKLYPSKLLWKSFTNYGKIGYMVSPTRLTPEAIPKTSPFQVTVCQARKVKEKKGHLPNMGSNKEELLLLTPDSAQNTLGAWTCVHRAI